MSSPVRGLVIEAPAASAVVIFSIGFDMFFLLSERMLPTFTPLEYILKSKSYFEDQYERIYKTYLCPCCNRRYCYVKYDIITTQSVDHRMQVGVMLGAQTQCYRSIEVRCAATNTNRLPIRRKKLHQRMYVCIR